MIDITHSEAITPPSYLNELEGILQQFLAKLGYADRGVTLYLCDDEEIQQYNERDRGKAKPTDILSWSYWEEDPDSPILGEMMLSMDRVATQAEANGWDERTEALRLLAHGCAHLVGYDHERSEAEEQKMLRVEIQLLETIQLAHVYR